MNIFCFIWRTVSVGRFTESCIFYWQKVSSYPQTNNISKCLSSPNVSCLSQGPNRLLSFGEVLFPPSFPRCAPAKLRSASSLIRASPLPGGCPSTSRRTTPLRTVVGWGSSVGTERDEPPDCPRDERDTGKIQESQHRIKFYGWDLICLLIKTIHRNNTTTFKTWRMIKKVLKFLYIKRLVDIDIGYISQYFNVESFHNFLIIKLFYSSNFPMNDF